MILIDLQWFSLTHFHTGRFGKPEEKEIVKKKEK
jgi:hypothetical protein